MRFSERKAKELKNKKSLSVCDTAKKIKWSFGGKGRDASAARTSNHSNRIDYKIKYQNNHTKDYKEKLKNTSITNQDFKAVMKKADSSETVHFLDPPYVASDHVYKERGVTPQDVCSIAKKMKGQVIITYDNHADVRKACKGLKMRKISTRYTLSANSNNTKSKELLITNK